MAHLFIDKIQPGQQINDIYLVSQPVLRSTTRGDLYIAMFISDKTGRLNGRIWQATEELFNSIPQEGFIHITRGRCESYQNNLQIIVDKLSTVDSKQVNIEDYLPRTEKNIDQMYEDTIGILDKIKNPFLRKLLNEFTEDEELMDNLCTAPAATKNHHNYIGGLLEHTNNMLNTALAVMPFYPKLQQDLVIAGIFLHDMGKTEELSYDMAFGYTDSGQLVGHIVQTAIMVSQKAAKLEQKGEKIDKAILDSITHIILSHHGQYEFGSPKLPMTAESWLISLLDNMDAKINQVIQNIEADPNQNNWTSFIRALDAKLYRKRVVD